MRQVNEVIKILFHDDDDFRGNPKKAFAMGNVSTFAYVCLLIARTQWVSVTSLIIHGKTRHRNRFISLKLCLFALPTTGKFVAINWLLSDLVSLSFTITTQRETPTQALST